ARAHYGHACRCRARHWPRSPREPGSSFHCHADHRALHSFPTRRSSDLSLLIEGTPVRLAGQDSRRGTFVQRHAVLHDRETGAERSEEHTSELQSRFDLVCRLLLEKKNKRTQQDTHSTANTTTRPTSAPT